MVEQSNGDWESPYRYTGQELDGLTGLYYYGARYYDPVVSNFIGVDPLADQFAAWTPYTYTLNNPIRYIDPDGMAPIQGGPGDPPKAKIKYTAMGPIPIIRARRICRYCIDNPLYVRYLQTGTGNGLSMPDNLPPEGRFSRIAKNGSALTMLIGMAPVAGGAASIGGSGFALSMSAEIAASMITGEPIDWYDAAAGIGGVGFYALSTPMIDFSLESGIRSGLDKNKSQLGLEYGVNMFGLGLGAFGKSMISKSNSLFSSGIQSLNIGNSITQSGINSHLSSGSFSSIGSSMILKSQKAKSLGTFSLGSVNAVDLLGKMITKENAN